ncbi:MULTISPECIES: hypothetical protein [unclassified Breznakia]|uniref:hypothetical protein n=1 Tax=unclassified Breznakia TaxID=2623764 RepID=UPI0024063610|nr:MULTISPECIES: hypothetical protein [unclassified Breznakia]
MELYNDFAIIDKVRRNNEYSFADAKNYKRIRILDYYVSFWADQLEDMNTFWHRLDSPNTALARAGVTIIPPRSLPLFYEVVEEAAQTKEEQELLALIEKAIEEKKYIIHFGV